MNIYLVRHGETEHNKSGFYYGKIDTELNSNGREQGDKVKQILKNIDIDKVYVSERKRTYEMAKLALGDRECEIVKDLRVNETDFGDFEGRTYEEIKELYPKECMEWEKNWKEFVPPNGESYIKLYSRIKNFMDDIKEKQYENVMVVTHSGVIRAIYCYIMNENLDLFWKFSCKNGDISVIKYEYGNFFIDSIVHC